MKSSRWLWLAVVWSAAACNLYNEALLEGIDGNDGPPTGGANSGGGGEDGTGATGNGGAPSGGGTTSGGGNGDGGMGMGGETGGADTGGGGTGGDTGGTGGDTGGSGGGSGGSPGPLIGLIDAFPDTSANYSNLPFYGSWSRYLQASPAAWTAASVGAMMQPRPDDAANRAFHVQATMLDDWGLGVFVTLKGSGLPVDLTGVTGIRFSVISMNAEPTLRVAIADEASHSPACMSVNAGVDCDKHMRSVDVPALTTSWAEVDLPLAGFIDTAVATPPRDDQALDITKIYAIHFQMETELVGEAADFYIDDVKTY